MYLPTQCYADDIIMDTCDDATEAWNYVGMCFKIFCYINEAGTAMEE